MPSSTIFQRVKYHQPGWFSSALQCMTEAKRLKKKVIALQMFSKCSREETGSGPQAAGLDGELLQLFSHNLFLSLRKKKKRTLQCMHISYLSDNLPPFPSAAADTRFVLFIDFTSALRKKINKEKKSNFPSRPLVHHCVCFHHCHFSHDWIWRLYGHRRLCSEGQVRLNVCVSFDLQFICCILTSISVFLWVEGTNKCKVCFYLH